MVCKALSRAEIRPIKLICLLPLAGVTLGSALISRYQNWETWIQYFAWTAFSPFFLFFAYLIQDSFTK